jgi:hypothetical protein
MRWLVASLTAAALLAVPASAGAAIGFRLAPGSPFSFPGTPANGVAAGDFNGDGKLDLAGASPNEAVVFLGDGTGGIGATRTSASGAANPVDVKATDFNRDGKLDLAISDGSGPGTVSVLLGDGTGNLAPAAGSPFSTGGNSASDIGDGDFNRDGNPDLAVANTTAPGTIGVLLGNGSGGFSLAGAPVSSGGNMPRGLAVGDLNLDSKLDLAVVNQGPPAAKLVVLRGDGTGGFPGAPPTFDLPAQSSQIALPNVVVRTGGPDPVVSVNSSPGALAVFNNKSDGTGFVEPVGTFGVGGDQPYGLEGADFDADGNVDVAVADQGSGGVSVLQGDGQGGLSLVNGTPFSTGTSSPAGLAIGDFNGDRQPDIAVAGAILLNANVGAVSLDPSAIDFGTQPLGSQTATRSITVRNTGTGFVSIVGVGGAGALGNDFPITGATCFVGRVLQVNDTCQVTAAFRPSGFGPRSASVEIFDTAPGSPHRVALKGSGPAAPVPDTTAPTIADLRADPASFSVGTASTAVTAKKKKKKRKPKRGGGTTFRFTLSEPAHLQLALRQILPGKLKGKRCVKPSKKLKKAKRCNRLQTAGALRRSGAAGANAVPFSGRVGRRALKPGRYQVEVAGSDDAGNKSAVATASFRVKRS